MNSTISKKGMKYVYPGRGVLAPEKKRKLPSRRKLFGDLSKAYGGASFLVASNHERLEGPDDDVQRAKVVFERLKTGALSPLPLDVEEEAMAYRLLSDTWTDGYGGTPKVLTQGKGTASKLVKYWLASEGVLFAAKAIAATWEIEPCQGRLLTRVSGEPLSEDFDGAFHYLWRPLPGFVLLQELRLALAHADEVSCREVAAWAREIREDLPLHLKGALAFLLPTERALVASVIDELEALSGTYGTAGGRFNVSIDLKWHWPSWVGALAWSVEKREDFDRLTTKEPHGGEDALGLACFVICPEALPDRMLDQLVREGFLEPKD